MSLAASQRIPSNYFAPKSEPTLSRASHSSPRIPQPTRATSLPHKVSRNTVSFLHQWLLDTSVFIQLATYVPVLGTVWQRKSENARSPDWESVPEVAKWLKCVYSTWWLKSTEKSYQGLKSACAQRPKSGNIAEAENLKLLIGSKRTWRTGVVSFVYPSLSTRNSETCHAPRSLGNVSHPT